MGRRRARPSPSVPSSRMNDDARRRSGDWVTPVTPRVALQFFPSRAFSRFMITLLCPKKGVWNFPTHESSRHLFLGKPHSRSTPVRVDGLDCFLHFHMSPGAADTPELGDHPAQSGGAGRAGGTVEPHTHRHFNHRDAETRGGREELA